MSTPTIQKYLEKFSIDKGIQWIFSMYDTVMPEGLMSIIHEVKESWGWVGIEPSEIVGENDFGNLIIKDIQGRFWRLCPEDTYCEVIAKNRKELEKLSHDQDFLHDWYMKTLVTQAKNAYGALKSGYKYGLVIPGVLGGDYAISNIKPVPLIELIRISGDIANQINDLPDGAKIRLQVEK